MLRALRESLAHLVDLHRHGRPASWSAGWRPDDRAPALKPLSTIFLRMIKSVVVPIIFGTLVIGIAGHGDDLKRIGRLAFKSIGYFGLDDHDRAGDRARRRQPHQARASA